MFIGCPLMDISLSKNNALCMQVFSTMPLRATIAFKWEAYARILLLQELLLYSIMLGLFTAYCILKGYTDKDKGKTLGWLGGGILLMTMLMALWKLYRVTRQFRYLCSDCKSGIVRPLLYWFGSGKGFNCSPNRVCW